MSAAAIRQQASMHARALSTAQIIASEILRVEKVCIHPAWRGAGRDGHDPASCQIALTANAHSTWHSVESWRPAAAPKGHGGNIALSGSPETEECAMGIALVVLCSEASQGSVRRPAAPGTAAVDRDP
jgi:hypothetical protein